MKPKLLPCPHCGNADIRLDDHGKIGRPPFHTGDSVFSIGCYKCGASVPNRYNRDLLVAAWNTRAAPATDEALVEVVARAIDDADVGYNIRLTNLVNEVATYTATCNGETREFEDHCEASEWVSAFRLETKARAAFAAMQDHITAREQAAFEHGASAMREAVKANQPENPYKDATAAHPYDTAIVDWHRAIRAIEILALKEQHNG